ncbi:MAG TPA: rhomboid family intramembrane serine protease, partial [Pirellulales bacterium]|nr:rhomboid family intramembrane serine protease [Pirellulales bacterium]
MIVTLELAAVVVTLWWWSGGNVELLTVDARIWQGQIWRLVSAALPHYDMIHLAFNLSCVAVFGSRVEEVFGPLVTTALLLVFAAGSMVADYDLADGGVGLSGVAYGLFGFLWVLAKRDRRFADAISPQTTQWLVLWLFLCIGLTYTGTWRVANVAHAAGAGFGALAGLVMAPPSGYRRPLAAAALVAALAAVLAAGAFARPYINFTGAAGRELDKLAIQAIQRGDNQAAADLLERAVRLRPARSEWWHNLGVAYHRQGR